MSRLRRGTNVWELSKMVENRRCVAVNGGVKGIGTGIVRRLSADGYWVAIFDRDRAAGASIRLSQISRQYVFDARGQPSRPDVH